MPPPLTPLRTIELPLPKSSPVTFSTSLTLPSANRQPGMFCWGRAVHARTNGHHTRKTKSNSTELSIRAPNYRCWVRLLLLFFCCYKNHRGAVLVDLTATDGPALGNSPVIPGPVGSLRQNVPEEKRVRWQRRGGLPHTPLPGRESERGGCPSLSALRAPAEAACVRACVRARVRATTLIKHYCNCTPQPNSSA